MAAINVEPLTRHQIRTAYEQRLRVLSQASVDQHFDAFRDIDWQHPDFAVDPADERWILPVDDSLGGSAWYRGLTRERQIEVGLIRQANITKVGLQFEQVLIAGIMNYALGLPNGSPEFRYLTHEATEECHHTQMFQEFVNRTGVDVPGGSLLFRLLAPTLPLAARIVPFAFFFGVLAGEEPIDHTQKAVLRRDPEAMHPLLRRIMAIHVAEEARHIGFAHEYIEHNAPKLGCGERFAISLFVPIVMRWLCNEILVPSRRVRRQLGMSRSVAKQIWWRDEASRKMLRDLFADVRMLCERAGLRGRGARCMWRLMGIDGRASRFRSEPATAAS